MPDSSANANCQSEPKQLERHTVITVATLLIMQEYQRKQVSLNDPGRVAMKGNDL